MDRNANDIEKLQHRKKKKSALLHKGSAPKPGLHKKYVKLKMNLVLIKK